MSGKFWTPAESYWVFWRARVTWDWPEGTGRVGLPELIISTAGRGASLFLKVIYDGSMPPFQAFCAFPPQQGAGKGKPIVWNRGCR